MTTHSAQLRWIIIILVWHAMILSCAQATPVIQWDFRTGLHGWKGNHFVTSLKQERYGISFTSTGMDPWIEGPAVHVPADRITRVTVRMKSNANAAGELFYGPSFKAGDSVRFVVQDDNQWHSYELIITDSLGPGTRFRLDPASAAGSITVQSILVESLQKIPTPPYETPRLPQVSHKPAVQLTSGPLMLKHYGQGLGNFELIVNETPMAVGYQSELLGVLLDEFEWLNLGQADVTIAGADSNHIQLVAKRQDSDGATWRCERTFGIGEIPGTFTVTSSLSVNQDRDVALLPWLTLYAGLGSFGAEKDQGLLAGLEYLSNEPSSSQADITTPEHIRRIPAPYKVTFPLMAIAQDDHYLGLIWQPSDLTNALFDSPDRVTNTNSHILGVTGPAVGKGRFENDPAAYQPVALKANQTIATTVTIIGGLGSTVVPATQHYVALKGLLAIPEVDGGLTGATRMLSHGWLDSEIREGGLFRHAVWQGKFNPTRAADAAMFMDWLATSLPTEDPLVLRLEQTRQLALVEIPPHHAYDSGVSHVRPPTAALVYGRLDKLLQNRQNSARNMLKGYTAEGTLPYKPGDIDFSTTHFANHANGYGGRNLFAILENASLTREPELVRDALTLLDKQATLYRNTVPRGAQTWELALHTPDIMASAHLVRAYVLGYLLSGNEDYLDEARYWAWTGVPFVYLVDPTPQPMGRYATIAVYGATHWVGSWFGRPVQWCGLVYGSALHMLSQVDPNGPWQQLALGITASGLQQTWTTDDVKRQGLLPDFIYPRSQIKDGPAINPGTVQATVPELFNLGTIYDVKAVPTKGWLIHAPCTISNIQTEPHEVRFKVDGWGALQRKNQYHVLISGVTSSTLQVMQRINGQWQNIAMEKVSHEKEPFGYLDLTLTGPTELRIRFGR